MDDPLLRLIEEFSRFPGVGPRQAKRFAYYLLTRDEKKLKTLTELLHSAKKTILPCSDCGRLFSKSNTTRSSRCLICTDESRDKTLLMVVSHDVDVDSVEKSAGYRGYYFVLGGTIPILEEKPDERVRLSGLKTQIAKRTSAGLSEIILALDLNPEGEHTMGYLSKFLTSLVKNIKVTVLGRGLSTGTELQYSDPETIQNALSNRALVK